MITLNINNTLLKEERDNYISNGPHPIFLKALKYIQHLKNKRALDLGCGSGGNLSYLKNKYNMQVEGCDRNPDNYEYHNTLDNLNIINCNVLDYPFIGNYDLIINFNVLMYLSKKDQVKLLKKIYKHLSDNNGIFILSIMTSGWNNSNERNVISDEEIFKIFNKPIDMISYDGKNNKKFIMFVFKK